MSILEIKSEIINVVSLKEQVFHQIQIDKDNIDLTAEYRELDKRFIELLGMLTK